MTGPFLHTIPIDSKHVRSGGDIILSYPEVVLVGFLGLVPICRGYPDIPSAYYDDELLKRKYSYSSGCTL